MSFTISKSQKKHYDCRVIPVCEGKIVLPEGMGKEQKAFLEKLCEKEGFTGKKGQTLRTDTAEGKETTRIALVGAGPAENVTSDSLRRALYKAMKGLKGSVLLENPAKLDVDPDMLGVLAAHINYRFDKYKTVKNGNGDKSAELELHWIGKSAAKTCEGAELGAITTIVRDLVNEPANVMTPRVLAENAVRLGKEFGFSVTVYGEKEIAKLGMDAFLAVSRASHNPPQFIVMRHTGNKADKNCTGLVGKGLCYDAGGLSIKPTASMLTMKSDMTGAATVIGVMCALAKVGVKKNVVAVVAACENVIGGAGYKPGDIIGTMNGKTLEVTNTDAEGRLTLADALTWIVRNGNVTEVIDVATLTGAIMVALGEHITGVFTNRPANFEKLRKAGEKWGERYWNMPMDEEFAEQIKSTTADLKNSAGRWGGASTAAKFLEEFVEGKPWMHLDIAGTSFSEEGDGYYPKGATGEVTKTLVTYIKDN
jgi:leucyl aminopeptidase